MPFVAICLKALETFTLVTPHDNMDVDEQGNIM